MDPLPPQYVDREGAALAYHLVGSGPVDVVFYFEIVQHIGLAWTDPDLHHVAERVAGFSRAAYFQRRGFGLSDQVAYLPTVEQQADDVLAVMDATGMRKATLVGIFGTCAAAALVAARAPERVSGLVLLEPFQAPVPDEPCGWADGEYAAFEAVARHAYTRWGSGGSVDLWDPVLATPYNRRLMGLLERCSATPSTALSYLDWLAELDTREVLGAVQVPTRLLHSPSNLLPEGVVRHAADLIPNSSFHLLPPSPPGASLGQSLIPLIEYVEELATGSHHPTDADRFLGTVLFTDVVASTELLARVGDARYRDLRSEHERLVRLAVETSGGRLLTVTGDGTMSVFDGPSKAVRCAEKICRQAEQSGITVRAGIHTGELERYGNNVTGMTVHTGARVGATAGPGEILVSRTVHDLVAGSGLAFVSRGEHELKGVPGRWELFSVARHLPQNDSVPLGESLQTPVDRFAVQAARRAPGVTRAALRLGNAIERRRARSG